VTLANKERVHAKLIGDDHWTDLAVVQMDMDEVRRKKFEFRHAELGRSDILQPCENVMAVGTPFGLARTVTLGIVSNTERTFYPDQMTIDEYETGRIRQLDPDGHADQPGQLRRAAGGHDRPRRRHQHARRRAESELRRADRHGEAGRRGEFEDGDAGERRDAWTARTLGSISKPLQDLESFYNIDINKGVLMQQRRAELAGDEGGREDAGQF
jgi:serine protease Do